MFRKIPTRNNDLAFITTEAFGPFQAIVTFFIFAPLERFVVKCVDDVFFAYILDLRGTCIHRAQTYST